MPIKIADSLPAKDILENENIFVMTEYRAMHQDIRPLKLLILNLMPTKIITETQLLRKLSNTPLQIEVEFLQTISHEAKNVNTEHLASFYTAFDKIKHKHYDGMIITGAPVENLDFSDVDYWPELCDIMAWTSHNVHSTLHICWGAQAGLYYHYGINKVQLPKKLSGVFSHNVLKPQSPFFRGFDDTFSVPHSRYTGVLEEDILKVHGLELMSVSGEAGVFALKSEDNRRFFITGHPEYDADTLALEYARDVKKGLEIEVPKNYFPNDDPTRPPMVTWRAHAQLLYTNWLNYYVYQTTPYNIDTIGDEAFGAGEFNNYGSGI
ncbi:homoserine O-succinyltransferase [Sporobacter termitidis DSM 10068]|uniref:Homoserine O-acetyltransferase n=1 Tax=Sporobacter termitidis DSM 10068 TaxID=1123282 RepID=A0A1M5Z5I8_9FIRM|nr:homoserine O-succinyltransferase [Sporobacter termitidis]SHI19368.1 homoserine O-succinyltransferase [Sporobacter termitidis DSM 10068]